jgi:hypothetical protein
MYILLYYIARSKHVLLLMEHAALREKVRHFLEKKLDEREHKKLLNKEAAQVICHARIP